MSYIGNNYKQFIELKGYFPNAFNVYNITEIKDIAPTQVCTCGNASSSAQVLTANTVYESEISLLLKKKRNEKMSKISLMRELVRTLNVYAEAYYVHDKPMISDREYDILYDKLAALEEELGIQLSNSPTVKVQGKVLEGMTKVTHSKPMLSAQKTKDVDGVNKWVNSRKYYTSYKLDGLTLVVRYENGRFTQAITRGSGMEGEDVTEAAKLLYNIPLTIPLHGSLELRGECVCSWEEFRRINKTLEEPFAHPRNLAAGTLRCLDTSVMKDRHLSFVAFECVTDIGIDDKVNILQHLNEIGFEVVGFSFDAEDTDFTTYIEAMQPEFCQYPVDGLIAELRSRAESLNTDSTAHHEGCRIAYKWADEAYSTILKDIEWNTSRTGLVAPVAIFNEINLDGAKTTRATLHNVSIIEKLQLGIGDEIAVYRSNMVIPAIAENHTKSNTYKLPTVCPTCGAPLELRVSASGTKNLFCNNDNCKAKFINKLTHFVSKHAMNIEGVSEAIAEILYENGFVECFSDLYNLTQYKDELINLEGFGEKSYENLVTAIEKSRNTTLERFIVAMGIPNIGRSAAKNIAKHLKGDIKAFIRETAMGFDYTALEDFGVIANESIHNWLHYFDKEELVKITNALNFDVSSYQIAEVSDNPFKGKSIAVTGKLVNFTRDSINAKIESLGAKPASGVSAKTHYLINNDPTSSSSKNKKANELNIPIITEEEFLKMIGE